MKSVSKMFGQPNLFMTKKHTRILDSSISKEKNQFAEKLQMYMNWTLHLVEKLYRKVAEINNYILIQIKFLSVAEIIPGLRSYLATIV